MFIRPSIFVTNSPTKSIFVGFLLDKNASGFFVLIFSTDHRAFFITKIVFLSFQLPAFLSKVQTALGLPAAPAQDFPVAGPSSGPPVIAPLSGAPPPIALEHSESEDEVQTLPVPVRSGSSEAFCPMVSTDDSWSTDTEFRFVFLSFSIFDSF